MDILASRIFFFLSICGIISGDIGPRNPILETVSYLNDIKDGNGKVRVSLTQTQLLIDSVWSRAGCGRDLDPVLCKKVSTLFMKGKYSCKLLNFQLVSVRQGFSYLFTCQIIYTD